MSTTPPSAAPPPPGGLPPEYTWAVPVAPGAGGYQPGYGAPATGTNGQAIASFVLGLLAVVPVSVVLGIVALVRIGRTRQRGKGLAVAGLVLSGLWAVAGGCGLVLAVMFAAAHPVAPTGPTAAAPGVQQLDAIPLGTCFDLPSGATDVATVTVVPCAQPHDRQLIARVDATGSFPGDTESAQESGTICDQQVSAAYLDGPGLVSQASIYSFWPSQSSYESGDPVFDCTLAQRDGGQLSGSLWPPTTTYTAAQTTYLMMTRRTTLLRWELADGEQSLWSEHRATATQLALADLAEANALDRASFQGSFEDSSARTLAADDRSEAATATALARSGSEAQWNTALTELDSSSLRDDSNTLRLALGLPGAFPG
jgi:hypothetical protein